MLPYLTKSISFFLIILCYNELSICSACPKSCPTKFEPVCTYYNGDCYRTFGNTCQVRAENCAVGTGGSKYKIVSKGKCEEQPEYSNNICPCPIDCALIFLPVCGYDSVCYKTFTNRCWLNSGNCWDKTDYFVYQHDGNCTVSETPVCPEQ